MKHYLDFYSTNIRGTFILFTFCKKKNTTFTQLFIIIEEGIYPLRFLVRPTTLNLTNIILHHSKANGDNQLYDSSTRHKNNKNN